MRTLCGVVLLALLARPVWADEPAAIPTVATIEMPARRPVLDTKFWLVGAALNSAMLLDTKSTFDVSRRCSTCFEANPFTAPFVNRGARVTFTAGELFDIGVMTVAARMKGARTERVRRVWWLVPVVITAGHLFAYRHNVGVEGDR